MKTINFSKWIIFLFIFSFAIIGCKKEEVVVPEPKPEEPKTEIPDDNKGLEESQDGELTLYKIVGDNIEKIKDYKATGNNLAFRKDIAKHQELWTLVKKIVPPSYRKKMNEFLIFAGEESGTAGFVVETSNDLSQWKMGIAIDFAYEGSFNADGQLAYTIIHEFGHILTLNNTQVDANISSASCQNFFTGEGCAKAESYIAKLYNNFWADIWSEFQAAGDSEEALQTFYEKYKDRFVTNYAATNPGEDIAEVFTYFVTQDDKPAGNTIAEKKIRDLPVTVLSYQNKKLEFQGNKIPEEIKKIITYLEDLISQY